MLIKGSNKLDNLDLGFLYIGESVDTSLGNPGFAHLDKINNGGIDVFYITFDTNLQDFDVQNRNKRYYDASNIMECIKTEKIQSLLRTGGWFGEFDHPTPENQNEQLTPERIRNVPPKKRAFKIMNPHLEGNILKAKIQSAQGEVGEGFAKEVLAGWIPQFSARAIATMVMRNGKPYVMVRLLITYDSVWYPSHKIAIATSPAKTTIKQFTESVMDKTQVAIEKAEELISNVTIPLQNILKDLGNTDPNLGLIMEAFDLDIDNLYGFDATHEHVIIKDEDNYIYSNINPESAKKVRDFYSSF